MEGLKTYWLGIPIIERDGNFIHLETRKAVALLAYLSFYSPSPFARENLATLFWPEYDQQHAFANLRRSLYSINRELGPNLIIANRENAMINPSCLFWQDVSEFCQRLANVKSHNHERIVCVECIDNLEKAVDLYRGSFLEGLNLRDSPEFDKWQYLQRDSFLQDLASSLEQLSVAYVSLGEWEKGIQRARHWVSLDHLNENAQRTLIELFALAGQHSAALHQFEEYSRALNDELGQSLDDQMREFYQKIRTGRLGKGDVFSKMSSSPVNIKLEKQPLIKTKLFIPYPRKNIVPRPLLLEKLTQGLTKPLILVSAPAGYGKTTLLAEWINSLPKKDSLTPWAVCWFSLDAGDNDPMRFLAYLTAALEKVDLELSAETQEIIHSFEGIYSKTPLAMLLNNLQVQDQSVLLVLDDYQFINNPAIHDGITFLLENLPGNVHVVIATRSDPPIPLSRLRARGQLSEIREEDLRFKTVEATRFLNQVFGLDLSKEQVTKLENRTEGWVAGLQLAAVSMQGRGDIPQFIDAFSGSHRFIMDYLAEEALSRQPLVIQNYLLRTSFLERMNDSLCDFVLGFHHERQTEIMSPMPGEIAKSMQSPIRLADLERTGLFIIPQDDDRVWYRYHRLFADLLRTRLQNSMPDLIPELQTRASLWFEMNGFVDEAITHALAARNWEMIDHLFDKYLYTYLGNGQMETVIRWIDEIPQEVILQYPKMCIEIANVCAEAGVIEKIDPLLNSAEEHMKANHILKDAFSENNTPVITQSQFTQIFSMIGILRGLKSVCSGDPQIALEFTQKVAAEYPDMEPQELVRLYQVEGLAYRNLGNLTIALERLHKAIELIQQRGLVPHDIWTDYGDLNRVAGKLPEAKRIFEETIRSAEERGLKNHGRISRDEIFLSVILLEQNQLEKALMHINRAIAYTRWWPSHNVIAIAYAIQAQVLLALHEIQSSIQAVENAERERKKRLMTPFVHNLIEETWVLVWLAQRNWMLLDRWLKKQVSALTVSELNGQPVDELLESRLILAVRICIEKTKLDQKKEHYQDCLSILEHLEKNSRNSGRGNSLVVVLLYKAIALFHESELDKALRVLDTCLDLAESGEYKRSFLDVGESSRVLLYAYLQQPDAIHRSYALSILREFNESLSTDNPKQIIPNMLTPREMDIIHLLAEGCSNREIAERLVLSVGTIKFHVHNIIGKLNATSRTQAIANARELNLI